MYEGATRVGDGPQSAIFDFLQQSDSADGGASSSGTAMSLASADDGGQPDWVTTGSGGSGGMSSDRKLWSRAGADVQSLHGNVKKAVGQLDEGQKGFSANATAVTGFVTGAEQMSVHRTWDRYLDLIRRETDELAGKLEKAGDDHYKNEEGIEAAFKQQQTKPEESRPAHGGHPSTGGRPTQGE